jgi:hypothetical protein
VVVVVVVFSGAGGNPISIFIIGTGTGRQVTTNVQSFFLFSN